MDDILMLKRRNPQTYIVLFAALLSLVALFFVSLRMEERLDNLNH